MIRMTPDEANRILHIEMQGTVSEADIDEAMDQLQERYPQVGVRVAGGSGGGISVLLDWERLDGWEKGAKTLGTITSKMMSDVARRVAIVADEKWRDEEARIADVAKQAKVRFFTLGRREQAEEWLRDR